MIEGRLQLDTWDDKATGQKRSRLRVVGEHLQLLGSVNAIQRQLPPLGLLRVVLFLHGLLDRHRHRRDHPRSNRRMFPTDDIVRLCATLGFRHYAEKSPDFEGFT